MVNFKLKGQLKSGKNNMLVTRTGHRYPNPEWATWRDNVLLQIKDQVKIEKPIDYAVQIFVINTNGDLRRRDVPGMMDALWHCLERSGIVIDDRDSILTSVRWDTRYIKNQPGTEVYIKDYLIEPNGFKDK